MDPNNGLCNQISASGACDFQRMYNFNNYPTTNNGYYTGNIFAGGTCSTSNTGGIFSGGNLYNTDINYSNGTYSYSNKPSGLAIGLFAFGTLGMVLGAWAQGKAAEEQQTQEQEQLFQKYKQWKEVNQQTFDLQKQQAIKQAQDEKLVNLLKIAAVLKESENAKPTE